MPDIRIKFAKDKAPLAKALRAKEGGTGPFQTYADVLTFGAVLGFHHQNRVPFQQGSRKDPDAVPADQFKNQVIIDLIAIATVQDPRILQNTDEILQEKAKIFEEYANGGFEILSSQVNGVTDLSKQILMIIQSIKHSSSADDIDVLSFL